MALTELKIKNARLPDNKKTAKIWNMQTPLKALRCGQDNYRWAMAYIFCWKSPKLMVRNNWSQLLVRLVASQ